MSVFHCFEDAFSFLPGGKNLMFLGGMVSGFMFLVSGVHPLCPSKLGGRAKRRGYDINGKGKTENGKLIAHRSPFTVHSFFTYPLPTSWYSPCLRGRKWMEYR